MPKPAILKLGEYSHGTLRPEDLLDTVLSALESIRLSVENRRLVTDWRRLYAAWARVGAFDDPSSAQAETMDALYEEACNILSVHCPEYCYWGAIEGDGACIGVWPDIDAMERDHADGELADLETAPLGYTGLAVSVSDHGNVSLYKCTRGRCRELWAIV